MQNFERFENQVEDMYKILLNISSELLTMKAMMKANRKLTVSASTADQDSKAEGKKLVNFEHTLTTA